VAADAPKVVSEEVRSASGFDQFVAKQGVRLRRALVARFGVDIGCDAWNAALSYAWEHWDDVAAMSNPVGHLYRVAQSSTRRHFSWYRRPVLPREQQEDPAGHGLDHDLGAALARLTAAQRSAVVLVHVYGHTYAEVAETLGITEAAGRNHVHRGLRRLRALLELS